MIEFAANLQRLGYPILGVVIPAAILVLAIVLTVLLYRHFAK